LSSDGERYVFHKHTKVPQWRLVLRLQAIVPDAICIADWHQTITRAKEDTNEDVRAEIAHVGFCLFKIIGTADELARDIDAQNSASS
jgi:hypothetical protein